jgi:hypothetical protein
MEWLRIVALVICGLIISVILVSGFVGMMTNWGRNNSYDVDAAEHEYDEFLKKNNIHDGN